MTRPMATAGDEKGHFAQDPESFFARLDENVELKTRLYREDNYLENEDWAEDVRANLEELGYAGTKADPAKDPFGIGGPIDKLRKDLGLATDEADHRTLGRVLEGLLDFDGDTLALKIDKPLRLESRGLFVRILQYRLKKLGFYQDDVSGEFDEETRFAVIHFKADFAIPMAADGMEVVDQELFEMLGDIYQLSGHVFKSLKGQPMLIHAVSKDGDGLEEKDPSEVFLYRGTFKYAAGYHADSLQSPDEITGSSINRSSLRILQLWMRVLCLYTGLEDGLFGPNSLAALRAYLEENMCQAKAYLVFIPGISNYIAVAPAIFELLGVEKPEADTVDAHRDHILEEVSGLLQRTEELAQKSPTPKGEDHQSAIGIAWEKTQKFFKHLFKRAKTAVVNASRAIARGAKWVWQQLGDLLGNGAMHVISSAIQSMREALIRFWEALKEFYAFAKSKIIQTSSKDSLCISFFDHDLDVVNYFHSSSGDENENLIRKHSAALRKTAGSFSLACDIIAAAFGIAIDIIMGLVIWPLWPRRAVEISRAIFNIIRKYKQEDSPAFAHA